MSGPIEGIIVLTSDGRPVVHSHFANRLPSYPLLHSDYFSTLLAGINSANAHLTSASDSSIAGPSSNRIYFTKDIKPVIWVPGVPDVNPLDLQDGSDDEEDEEMEADVTANMGELSLASQLSARISASRAAEEANVWDEGRPPTSNSAPSDPQPPPPAPPSGETRGAQVVQQAAEALAEQGAALVQIASGPLRFLCPVSREVDPLLPLTFLRSFISILQEYLASSTDPSLLTEDVLRDHFDVVYQLFEEIIDTDGNVLTTEINTLKSLVLPPSWTSKLINAVGVSSLSSAAPPPLISTIPWRRPNSKYTNNELYVDLIESLEGIVERGGKVRTLDVWGKIECNARLSGTPELELRFDKPAMVGDESWHPCVRGRVWRKEKRLSFVPPDGKFELMSFRVGEPSLATGGGPGKSPTNGWSKAIPVSVSHCIELEKGSATALIQVSAVRSGSSLSTSSGFGSSAHRTTSKSGPDPPGTLEEINLTFGLGPGVVSFEATTGGGLVQTSSSSTPALNAGIVPSAGDVYGSHIYDPNTKVIKWTIPKLSPQSRPALLKMTWTTSDTKATPTHSSGITVGWSNSQGGLSGLRVASVEVTNKQTHGYRPFKGVRSISTGKLVYRV